MTETFPELLATLLSESGRTKKAFAEAIGIAPSRLSHHLRPARYTAPPGIEFCLLIAKACNCNASRVLRAAGKERIAMLIEDLYGAPAAKRVSRNAAVSPAERDLVHLLRTMGPKHSRNITVLVQGLADYHRERQRRASA